ncbi:MAG: YjjG family noncanonical pyrimidine nucleotidase [Deltaproteobacteria bacterium]
MSGAVQREFDLILFDADGTLFDFAKSERLAFDACLRRFAGAGDQGGAYLAYVEISAGFWLRLEQGAITKGELRVGRWLELGRRCGFEWSAETVSDAYLEELSQHGHVIDGAVEVCSAIRQTHALGIVTNGFEMVQTRRLAASPLRGLIDFLVTSEAAGAAKPARAVFDRALELAGRELRPERVLMVGDGLSSDIAGGNAMGFRTCWYTPRPQPAPEHVLPDYVISDLRELTAIVR